MHKIDFFLFPDVSKYQKVIKIADCIPETDSGFWFFFEYYKTISTTEAERKATQTKRRKLQQGSLDIFLSRNNDRR